MRSAIGRAFLQIAICATAPHACAPAVGAMTLAAGGSATDALKATAFAFASQMVWTEVGFHVRDAGIASNIVAKSAVHGVVGGALSMAQGGTFVDGFVANGVGAAAGIVTGDSPLGSVSGGEGVFFRTAIAAAAGGTASALTGGKFANGAVTAAMAHLFNAEGGNLAAKREFHQLAVSWTRMSMEAEGYKVLAEGDLAVNVPGLGTRFYDLIVYPPSDSTGSNATAVGIEVKTTWSDVIRLDKNQVEKDVYVAVNGAAATNGIFVKGVGYAGYSTSDSAVAAWRSRRLGVMLDAAGIKRNCSTGGSHKAIGC